MYKWSEIRWCLNEADHEGFHEVETGKRILGE